MQTLDENIYRLLFDMSERAIELAKVHLKDDKKKFFQMRDYIVVLTHQQKRRARKGIADKTYSDANLPFASHS